MSMSPSDIAILNMKGSDYRCIISRISKSEVIKHLQNTDLTKKRGTLWKLNFNNTFWSCKFFTNFNLIKKSENYKIKKIYIQNFRKYIWT